MELFDRERRGMVLRMEKSSIHDGSGFRTVVFLKGCPLRCQWCSTPESHSPDVQRAGDKVYGQEMTVEEVMREIRKDSAFFFISGGGVTLSGGELLSQSEFSLAILKNARMEGIDTAIETSFFAPWEKIRGILPHVKTAYVDIKAFSPELHMEYCGVGNRLILSNLLATNDAEGDFRLVVRTPLIPGVNDAEAELAGIGAFCARLKRLDHVELLPYHRLGVETYKRLGLTYALGNVIPPSAEDMERCRKIVARYVKNVR